MIEYVTAAVILLVAFIAVMAVLDAALIRRRDRSVGTVTEHMAPCCPAGDPGCGSQLSGEECL